MTARAITGYIGVVDGKPVYEDVSDDHGEAKRFDVFLRKDDALARWDRARRVRIMVDSQDLPSPNRGKR